MYKKPRLLILSFTDARRDPRVYKQAFFLRDSYDVSVAGFADPGIVDVKFIPIDHVPSKNIAGRLWRAGSLLLGNSKPFLNRFALRDKQILDSSHFDIVLANDDEPLPLAFAFAKGGPVIFDAHEYYPLLYEDIFWKTFHKPHVRRLCRDYIPKCAGMMTVCSGIAKEYANTYGAHPEIIYNAPMYQQLDISGADKNKIRLIHHGGATPDRGIEQMIDMVKHLDKRFSLDMILVGNLDYVAQLREYARGKGKINWLLPVPMLNISAMLNAYDMGLFLVPPSTFNLQHCLPNKFFEFIQARLAIAIGPSPEMAAIVNKHELGVVADDFTPENLASKLNALTANDVLRFKQNSDDAARIYNAEAGVSVIKQVLEKALRAR